MKTFIKITLLAAAISLAGCGRHTSAATIYELPLPVVPDTLRVPEDRAAYVALHFWDAMDFTDRNLTHDTAVIEQNFANFASVLAVAPPEDAAAAIERLLQRTVADADTVAWQLLNHTGNIYLGERDSPVYNENVYILWLRSLIDSPLIGEAGRERLNDRLTETLRNRPGDKAPDFTLVLRNGKRRQLHNLLTPGRNILIFYDHNCVDCQEILGNLSENHELANVRFIAVDTATESSLTISSQTIALPDFWIAGRADENTEPDELYYLPSTPTFYVLDGEGTIELKDATLKEIEALLHWEAGRQSAGC
ncbi:MAG: DUF5106 domain-containing protein [Muribaculaceae bacterium]|nr:DUF5106 domain-containing protein [Muribaculaceae bacterium]MDE7189157.1 DUF5106 domain-containing protein [Muribaculaceae bacterium]